MVLVLIVFQPFVMLISSRLCHDISYIVKLIYPIPGMDGKTLIYQMLSSTNNVNVTPTQTSSPRVLGQSRQAQPVARW